MRRIFVLASLTFLAGGLVFSVTPQAAEATLPQSVSPLSSNTAPKPLPDTLTDSEMKRVVSGMKKNSTGQLSLAAPPAALAKAAKKSPLCTQDTGVVYKRTSGSPYKYGTVGSKPSLTCNTPVTYLALSTFVYKKTIWGWQKVTKEFKNQNWGTSSLTQKSVEYVCSKAQPYTYFRVIAKGTVTYPGLKPIYGGAYSDTEKPGLPCS